MNFPRLSKGLRIRRAPFAGMRGFRAVLLCTLPIFGLPTQAQALSCSPPNAAHEIQSRMDDPNLRVLVGRLAPKQAVPRQIGYETLWSVAEFSGYEVADNGKTPRRLQIRIAASCIASWCADIPDQPIEGLFVLGSLDPAKDPVLHVHACGGAIYPTPTTDQTRALFECMHHRECSDDAIAAFSVR